MDLSKVRPIIPRQTYDLMDLNDPNWLMELKFDGYRAFLHIGENSANFVSRADREMVEFDSLANLIRRELRIKKCLLDGEIVALDPETGYSDPSQLRRRSSMLAFMAFDLLLFNNVSLIGKSLRERKEKLQQLVSGKEYIHFVESVAGKQATRKLLRAVLRCGYEGVVIKNSQDIYTPMARWFKYINPSYRKKPKR